VAPPLSSRAQRTGDREEGEAWHSRHEREGAGHARQEEERSAAAEELQADVVAQPGSLLPRSNPGHHQTGGDRDAEGGHLAHKPIADRDERIACECLLSVEPVLEHSDEHAAHAVDQDDHQAGEHVALHELHRPVHRPEHLGLPLEAPSAFAGDALVDEPGPEIGIDRHLLARHGVQGEARRDLAHPFGALGNHEELHQRHHGEDHGADDVVAPHHELAERLDHRAGMALGQREPSG